MTEELKPCPYCGSGRRFTHRPLLLSDPEMAGAMQRLKDRIASDPAFALRLLTSAGLEPIVCGQGDTTVAQTYMDLHAGAQQLMAMTAPERG